MVARQKPSAVAAVKRYAATEGGKEARRKAQAKYAKTLAGKKTRWRYLHSEPGKELLGRTRERRKPTRFYDFVGVDGEGGGNDEYGRQHYKLLRAGGDLLFDNNRPLTSDDCLAFLADLPPKRQYVSFYFDYDATQILRDIPSDKLNDLLSRRSLAKRIDERVSDTILWKGFQIGYFPRRHFKVRRVDWNNKPISKWVTIHDCGTFFQTSFVVALEQWGIMTPVDREAIRIDKQRRNDFDDMSEREIEYNRKECEALAELMTKFRAVCMDLGYIPRQWEGPGYLASAMMRAHNVIEKKDHTTPLELLRYANEAYYGGRFEIFKIGRVPKVREYDICSAYPSSYLDLPCLRHGEWTYHEAGEALPDDEIYLAHVQYSHRDPEPIVCNLPHRLKSGSLIWQREGRGKYWSIELRAAIAAGTVVREVYSHWRYHRRCDCQPFGNWVREVYAKRLAIGKSVQGYPLKLALNSVYGKCVQSIGRPPFATPVWGGMITAATRARLIEGYTGIDPRRIVMMATDGLYVTGAPLRHLNIGNQLGDWEVSEPDDIFIIKPGMYSWNERKSIKTRGVPKAFFQTRLPQIHQIFDDWWEMYWKAQEFGAEEPGDWPWFPMPVTVFVGTRLALARHKPETAGKWTRTTVRQSFDPRIKRVPARAWRGHIETKAHLGSPSFESIPYNKVIGGAVKKEYREIMKDVLEIKPFEMQVSFDNYALLISGLDDGQLYQDNDDEDFDPSEVF